ncbi:unnamed protein product, partial [Amoebophrya sp. A25]
VLKRQIEEAAAEEGDRRNTSSTTTLSEDEALNLKLPEPPKTTTTQAKFQHHLRGENVTQE